MERTRNRPIPSGRIQPYQAWIFALCLGILSFSMLTIFANLSAALLAMAGIGFYVVIYTHLLKAIHPKYCHWRCSGAIPTLVGWAAVNDRLSLAAWILFAIVFVWTPPHFWALSLMIKDDYAKVWRADVARSCRRSRNSKTDFYLHLNSHSR